MNELNELLSPSNTSFNNFYLGALEKYYHLPPPPEELLNDQRSKAVAVVSECEEVELYVL